MKFNSITATYDIPVLFIIFNRFDLTQRVFNEIRKVEPSKLFVSGDGPREGVADDVILCNKTRDIIKQIDWDCEVFTNFRAENVGCKLGVSSAIDWFFENVEEGIILEDDCLPDPTFFSFCQQMLEKFRHDERIKMISGDNFQFGQVRGDGDYYFSRLPGIWGWATWKRAWKHFDLSMSSFSEFKKQNQIRNIFPERKTQEFWIYKYQQAVDKSQAWAFAWAYSILVENGLCICPNRNLVSNIGFGPQAVHAKNRNDPMANMKTYQMDQINHPTFILPDVNADIYQSHFLARLQMPSRRMRIRNKIVKQVKTLIGKIKG